MPNHLYIPSDTPLENAEHLARVAYKLMVGARRRAHHADFRDEWSMGLAYGYKVALRGALAMRQQLRKPRIIARTRYPAPGVWEHRSDGTWIRREPERFTPAWIEGHRELPAAPQRSARFLRDMDY